MNDLMSLVRLADDLDGRGMFREADQVDHIIKHAIEWSRMGGWLRKQYERLRRLFSRKKSKPSMAKEYDTAAGTRLDDMLRKKQSGPPDERIFLWFCNRFPNSCLSCADRHGRVRTLRQWRAEGLPGPAVCEKGDGCRCRLVQMGPGGAIQTDEDGNFMAATVGLREDNSGSSMNQGFSLEPFFSSTKID